MFTPFSVKGCSLELLRIGEKGIVTFWKPADAKSFSALMAMALAAGTNITVKQKFPNFQVEVNNITFFLNQEIARTIYVRIVES
jgi:ferrous iron transport protein A